MKLTNTAGLSIEFLENGSVKHIEAEPIRISLKAATPFSKSGANIFLRKRSEPLEYKALTGPESNSSFQLNGEVFVARGSWEGLNYTCSLQLSKSSMTWQWQIDLTNSTDYPIELDLVYLQDVGLKPITAGLVNEYYVSQYLERLVLVDQQYGAVVCCRQNMMESVGHPWMMIAGKNPSAAGSVDGMQIYGKTYRETGIPEGLVADTLSGNYAGESSIIALQEKPFILEGGQHHHSAFIGTYLPDHELATTVDDLLGLSGCFLEFADYECGTDPYPIKLPAKNLFNTSSFLKADDLTASEIDQYFGPEKRFCEIENGQLLSFFHGKNYHVMLRKKETVADRPHAQIMQAKAGFAPDENIVSTTAFAFGVFNSHLSQGNTNFGVLLSVCTSQFNVSPESGQRIFVEIDNSFYLLGVPSAFETGLNFCRWIYKHENHLFQIRTWTSMNSPKVNLDFQVLSGPDVRILITHDFDHLNGWEVHPGNDPGQFIATPAAESMIVEKFPDAKFRIIINSEDSDYKVCSDEALYTGEKIISKSLFILDVNHTSNFCLSIIGEVVMDVYNSIIEDADAQCLTDCQDAHSFWQQLSLKLLLKGDHVDTKAIGEILPWYGMNALIHFLTPYGLEQFSGAAWGTRDVSQGPVDLLLTMEKYSEAKQVLRVIFSNQNPDGGWPQWWMFDRFSSIRAGDSHGDVFYWVIIALSNYIKVTGDLTILSETLPYYGNSNSQTELTTVSEHVGRLIRMVIDSFIPGTSLVPFGGGDWNDSLQPVNKELADRMISSWTVEMNYLAFMQYQTVYELEGDIPRAHELKEICEGIKSDFNKFLVKDGVVGGYGLVEIDGSISLMLHPGDTKTGVRFSLLPMERGIISEIFTREQAEHHQDLIEKHLKGPDGARLMDRPLKYRGGIQKIFQRAESSTFFGREIGLMYVHEHIRYAESLARTGKADAFVKALRQAIPIAYKQVVPCGDIRQSNCYYSSSDVAFETRYQADELYDKIKTGKIELRGGWRVYSSGPGIYVSLIVTRLLGIRIEYGNVIIDPVIPQSMDGLSASMDFMGYPVTFCYAVKENSFSPKTITLDRKDLPFKYEINKYRQGGAVIPVAVFLERLSHHGSFVEILL
jgi:cellobiose phosphorylase